MTTPIFNEEAYLATARSRVTEQLKLDTTDNSGAVVFDKLLQLLVSAQSDIQDVFKDLLQLRDIDNATGAQLDVIGRIVGQDRVLLNADLYSFFGMQGALRAASFGEYGSNLYGGKFLNYGSPTGGNVQLDDDTYRLFIRAKIYKNTTQSTPEQFLEVINLIFGTTNTFLSEDGNADVTVLFGRQLSDYERVVLAYVNSTDGYPSRLIPKTVGVGVQYGEYQAGNFFGFDGVPGAMGFGEINGTYGYGLGYGLNYGQSDYDNHSGGVFATLY